MNHPLLLSLPPPTTILHSGSFLALSIYPVIFVKAFSSITAVIKFVKSLQSPILILFISEIRFSSIPFHTEFGMYALLAAEHFCPWYSKAPLNRATVSPLWSPSGCATTKSFPTVSPTMRGYPFSDGKAWATLCHIPWNTFVEPVKWIPAKSGFASAVSVISAPDPGKKLITPFGNPASIINCINR